MLVWYLIMIAIERRPGRWALVEGVRSDLHPGVEALGYVNRTTPLLLSSTSFFKVVLRPACVSITPPNPSRSIESPATNSCDFPVPFVDRMASLCGVGSGLDVGFATEPAFFWGG